MGANGDPDMASDTERVHGTPQPRAGLSTLGSASRGVQSAFVTERTPSRATDARASADASRRCRGGPLSRRATRGLPRGWSSTFANLTTFPGWATLYST